jgi:hypothetical protein
MLISIDKDKWERIKMLVGSIDFQNGVWDNSKAQHVLEELKKIVVDP